MILNVSKRLIRPVVLTMIVAAVGGFSSSASAARQQAAENARAAAMITVRSTRFGRILFDGRGRALYAFTRDPRGGRSQCYGACARAWPVYVARGQLLAGPGVRQSLIGTSRRRGAARQVTYNGRPLYYYVGDTRPGQVLCQNVDEFGGTWLVVRPNGQLVR